MLFVQKQLLQAIDIYTDMGRFTIAAKHHETIAGIFESEVDFCNLHATSISDSNYEIAFKTKFFSVLTLTKQCSTTSRWKESIGLVILTPCESGCWLLQGGGIQQLCQQVHVEGDKVKRKSGYPVTWHELLLGCPVRSHSGELQQSYPDLRAGEWSAHIQYHLHSRKLPLVRWQPQHWSPVF